MRRCFWRGPPDDEEYPTPRAGDYLKTPSGTLYFVAVSDERPSRDGRSRTVLDLERVHRLPALATPQSFMWDRPKVGVS